MCSGNITQQCFAVTFDLNWNLTYCGSYILHNTLGYIISDLQQANCSFLLYCLLNGLIAEAFLPSFNHTFKLYPYK